MMSAGGRGSQKSRRKEQSQLICDSDKGVGAKKSENFADVIYGSPREFTYVHMLHEHICTILHDNLRSLFFPGNR